MKKGSGVFNDDIAMNPKVKKRLINSFEELLKYKEKRRNQDEIISDIVSNLKNVKKESFLPFLLQMINAIELRHSLEFFENLMSPLKQLVYLIDVYFSVVHEDESKTAPNEEEWNRITELLREIEMTYFSEIGFYGDSTGQFQANKVSVSLKSFFDFYSNGQLSYDEQTLGRLQTNFERFDDEIFEKHGFKTKDILDFCFHIHALTQSKMDKCFYYQKHPEEFAKLVTKLQQQGLTDYKGWVNEPEFVEILNFIKTPGYIFIHTREEIGQLAINEHKINNLIAFLKYDESSLKGRVIYYSDNRHYSERPIIELVSSRFLCPNFKFLIEAFYNRINSELKETKKEKYTQRKNKLLEKKTFDIFQKFFGKEAQMFSSFYIDKKNISEQDLVIYYKSNLLIVEIKDFNFRAPMRNPIKAFDKIRSDFKGGIQKAYDQCKRIEDKIKIGEDFQIYDLETNKIIFEIKPKRIENFYSIIVTQHKYGAIQTNLEELLVKEKNNRHPFSICIDDLEIFLLALKKIKKGRSASILFDYLEIREKYHGRLVCADELELCGLFLNSPNVLTKYANHEEVFVTDTRMSEIFDAHYFNGLGFSNEISIDRKRTQPIKEYAKNFDVNFISGNDLLNDQNTNS